MRQDPDHPNLLFAGTSSTVYFSLDGGQHWQPLTLNLPAVRVKDVEIQPEQHAVVLATFGRGFWVLDDLQFLEQLGTAQVASDAPYLFKPQQAWLVTRGGGRRAMAGSGPGGENLAPGATVFFHLPADYNGSTPGEAELHRRKRQVDPQLHAAPEDERQAGAAFGQPHSGAKATEEKLTAVEPGMNRFQWDLSYADAVDVKGIFNSSFAAAAPVGPEVVPGTYYVTLTYGDTTQKQPFMVKLDPQLQTTQAELQQRFDLLMRLHDALNRLDTNLNQAIDARDALEKAVAGKSVVRQSGATGAGPPEP